MLQFHFFTFFPEPILKNKQITCFDAAFLLAYSIFVREKDTLVYSFTDSVDKLQPLNIIMRKNNYKIAKEAVVFETVRFNNQICCCFIKCPK